MEKTRVKFFFDISMSISLAKKYAHRISYDNIVNGNRGNSLTAHHNNEKGYNGQQNIISLAFSLLFFSVCLFVRFLGCNVVDVKISEAEIQEENRTKWISLHRKFLIVRIQFDSWFSILVSVRVTFFLLFSLFNLFYFLCCSSFYQFCYFA